MGTWGGPGRGQGKKPIYDENMPKIQLRLPASLVAYLKSGREASPRLRRLLEWGDAHPDHLLLPDQKKGGQTRTSYALSPEHIALAEKIGEGNRTAGVRIVIHTAMELGLDPDNPPD
jgi:hypothetical protein